MRSIRLKMFPIRDLRVSVVFRTSVTTLNSLKHDRTLKHDYIKHHKKFSPCSNDSLRNTVKCILKSETHTRKNRLLEKNMRHILSSWVYSAMTDASIQLVALAPPDVFNCNSILTSETQLQNCRPRHCAGSCQRRRHRAGTSLFELG